MFSSRQEKLAAIQKIFDEYSIPRTINRLDLTNVPGEIYIYTDPHGRHDLFQQMLAEITDEDVLLSGGDNADRGPDSLKLFDEYFKFKNDRASRGYPPIIGVPGNHEENYIDLFRSRLIAKTILNAETLRSIDEHYAQNPTLDETSWRNKLKELGLAQDDECDIWDYIYNRQFIEQPKIGGQWASDLICKEEKGEAIAKEIATMASILSCTFIPQFSNPYIQCPDVFDLTHAGIPISDQELDERDTLTTEEQIYAANARPEEIKKTITAMDPHLSVIFSGHNVMNQKEDAVTGRQIILDTGAYSPERGILFLYGVKANKVKLIIDKNIEQTKSETLNAFKYFAQYIEYCVGMRRHQLELMIINEIKENEKRQEENKKVPEEKDNNKENIIAAPTTSSCESKRKHDNAETQTTPLKANTFLNVLSENNAANAKASEKENTSKKIRPSSP